MILDDFGVLLFQETSILKITIKTMAQLPQHLGDKTRLIARMTWETHFDGRPEISRTRSIADGFPNIATPPKKKKLVEVL